MFGAKRSLVSRFGVAGSALAIALGIGFIMQRGDSGHLTAMYAEAEMRMPELVNIPEGLDRTVPAQPVAASVDETANLQDLLQAQAVDVQPTAPEPAAGLGGQISGIQFTSSDPGVSLPQASQTAPRPSAMLQAVAPVPQDTVQCDPVLQATSAAAAMIKVSVSAPCHSNARVTLHHEGMMFTVQTDGDGMANVDVPALKQSSVVIAAFEDGTGAVVETEAPELAGYDRVVLQWQGDNGLQIHAFEFGANYNQDGHVWSGQPQEASLTVSGSGGFILQLGDPSVNDPLLAEVYTFPSGMTSQAGAVDMTVEAEVTRHNCERSVSAQTLQFAPNEGLTIQDLTLSLPSCQAIGEFLVLNNLLNPVQLAQR